MTLPLVSVTIVTYNSARYIARSLDYLAASEYPALDVIVVDNCSTDGTRQILSRYSGRARLALKVVLNDVNNGFAGGQNQAIALARGEWVLTLNPDVRLTPGFIYELVRHAQADEHVGAVCGKLLAMSGNFEPFQPPRFDSTGIFFTPNLRHLDRGSNESDTGQYDREEFVFGATGAAALFRRQMIADLSDGAEFFDEAFFAYREDADVAWRAQLLGWKCLYVPQAIAYHVRSVVPANRRSQPAVINMHSVKNRFLMRLKNATWALYRRHGIAITLRDLVVVAGCLLREWTSLPAFWKVLQGARAALRKRQRTMLRRRVSDAYVVSWFSYTPVSFPVTEHLSLNKSGDEAARP